ncbi:MAG: U32 family peptidase, partial [Rhodospirillales bacterium]|nr:U32 family peptidase [Rhodospirillales bacterium]
MSGKLTLGPILFNWEAEVWRDFYFRMAGEAPLDCVYLGEVVCSKRQPFTQPHMAEVTERLQAAGIQVIHSTLALLMSEREVDLTRQMIQESDCLIEGNDISAVSLLGGKPHVIGPYISCYNEGSLAYFTGRGAVRVVLPAELPADALDPLAAHGGANSAELEMQVFGRLPLALSARCYHARSKGLHKDNCQYVCAGDSDGMELETLDGEAFLAINGTQTLSHGYYNLAGELD